MTWPAAPLIPTAPPSSTRPGPHCPANAGAGVDVRHARFVLAVDDCINGPDRKPTATEIFGFFAVPGDEHDHDDDEDVVLTGGLEVPISSPIARLAHHVSADALSVARAGDILRRNVADCPCRPCEDCPALTDVKLLEAVESAAG